jgi:hypothetical protein
MPSFDSVIFDHAVPGNFESEVDPTDQIRSGRFEAAYGKATRAEHRGIKCNSTV